MRLLIAMPDAALAAAIQAEMENRLWRVEAECDGRRIPALAAGFDVLLIHHCLCGLDGWHACESLAASRLLCPPRILFVTPADFVSHPPPWADSIVEAGVSVHRLCALLLQLAQKPLPRMAAAQMCETLRMAQQFLNDIEMDCHLRGYAYAAWLLARMLPSPLWERQPLSLSYAACAEAFGVSAASVERCLRVAVENVFTSGSMKGIEQYFGATVDPERGKPTNRAFLLQAAQQLRLLHSRAAERSPNKSEMHHKPAAPTSV